RSRGRTWSRTGPDRATLGIIGVICAVAGFFVRWIAGRSRIFRARLGSHRRLVLIRTTAEGRRMHERARATIAVIESVLADHIGAAVFDALRQT
ncbi:hypothetical protein AB0D86_32795, partial [Streptomyces sp. NPDC048324]